MEPEQIIRSMPDEDYSEKHCGAIKIKFMRIMPSFKIIDKDIPLSFVFDSLYLIKKEFNNNGILVSINSNNLKIKDYFLFVKSLFKNQKVKVEDLQRCQEKGTPDFKITGENDFEFYIEFKSISDSVRPVQLQWMGDNSDKEVWFLILENIETSIETEGNEFRSLHLSSMKTQLVNEISRDVCNTLESNIQNIKTKIIPKETISN